MTADEIISTRALTHGRFIDTATIAQNLKAAASNPVYRLEPNQREALDMIFVKMARILSGDPSNADHWDDIAGYAQLGKDGNR